MPIVVGLPSPGRSFPLWVIRGCRSTSASAEVACLGHVDSTVEDDTATHFLANGEVDEYKIELLTIMKE